MANVLTQNPIIVDTLSAAALITQPLRVKKIRWVPAATGAVDDEVIVKNKHGAVMWRNLITDIGTVGQVLEAVESDFEDFVIDGLLVDTLTSSSGSLFIYVNDNPPFKTS